MPDDTSKTDFALLHLDAGTDQELQKEVSGLTVLSRLRWHLHTAFCILLHTGILDIAY